METTIIETTETAEAVTITETEVIEAIVSNFTELTKLIEAENANFSEVKAVKIAEIETAMQAVWLSGKNIEAKMAETSQLFDAKKHLELQTGVTLNSVLANNAKYVMYNDILYKFDTKQVASATMQRAKTLRGEPNAKVSPSVHRDKWAGKLIGYKHGEAVIPFGNTEHIDADAINRGVADAGGKVKMSSYIKARVKEHDGVNYNEQFNPSGWSNPALVEIPSN